MRIIILVTTNNCIDATKLTLEKTNVFHNVFKVWMKCGKTVEVEFHNFFPFTRYGTQAVCGISVELKCGISVEIMWNLSDHNITYRVNFVWN